MVFKNVQNPHRVVIYKGHGMIKRGPIQRKISFDLIYDKTKY